MNGKRILKNLTKNVLKESAGAFLANDLQFIFIRFLFYLVTYLEISIESIDQIIKEVFSIFLMGVMIQKELKKTKDPKSLNIVSLIDTTLSNEDQMEYLLPISRKLLGLMMVCRNFEHEIIKQFTHRVYDSAIEEFNDIMQLCLISTSEIISYFKENVNIF